MDEKLMEKRPVPYSAGTVILKLTPGEESVALVLNKFDEEVQEVPKSELNRPEFRNRVLYETKDGAVVSFDQKAGFGTPFGKYENDDGDCNLPETRVKTALRETLEETGSSVNDRIITEISYTEKPNGWGRYSNTVFPANGIGFEFMRDLIADPQTDPERCGLYRLDCLPLAEAEPMYQAAVRRIVAILLQLKPEQLREFGRPNCESADDLVFTVLGAIHYRNLFSHRMLKTLTELGRHDILFERLENDRGMFRSASLVQHMVSNLVLWLKEELVERAVKAIRIRLGVELLDRHAFSWKQEGRVVRGRFNEMLNWRRNRTAKRAYSVLDKKQGLMRREERILSAPESGEYLDIPDADADYVKIWMEAEAAEGTKAISKE